MTTAREHLRRDAPGFTVLHPRMAFHVSMNGAVAIIVPGTPSGAGHQIRRQ